MFYYWFVSNEKSLCCIINQLIPFSISFFVIRHGRAKIDQWTEECTLAGGKTIRCDINKGKSWLTHTHTYIHAHLFHRFLSPLISRFLSYHLIVLPSHHLIIFCLVISQSYGNWHWRLFVMPDLGIRWMWLTSLLRGTFRTWTTKWTTESWTQLIFGVCSFLSEKEGLKYEYNYAL